MPVTAPTPPDLAELLDLPALRVQILKHNPSMDMNLPTLDVDSLKQVIMRSVAAIQGHPTLRRLWAELTPTRRGVVVHLVDDLGLAGLLQLTAMLNCLASQDWQGAATALLQTEWATQSWPRANDLAVKLANNHER